MNNVVPEVDEDLTLHQELIEYATTSFRLLFIQEASEFTDFRSSNEAFNDLSQMALTEIMLKNILPKINSYHLTDTAKKRLKYLDLHPGFRKTDQGYQYTPQHLSAPFVLRPKCDFSLTAQLPELVSEQRRRPLEKEFSPNGPINNEAICQSHTMLVESDAMRSHVIPKFQLSLDIATLFSAMVSTDLELSSAQLHNLHEIQRRLQQAKKSFEDNGRMLPYRNDLEILINYIASFEQLKTKFFRALASF